VRISNARALAERVGSDGWPRPDRADHDLIRPTIRLGGGPIPVAACRLHQRVQQIEDSVLGAVIGFDYRAATLEVKSA